MTIEQKIQLWIVIGTWFTGIATFSATVVALFLARRAEKIRLKIRVGISKLFIGEGLPQGRNICFDVTNIGMRPVTINEIGWAVGKGKNKKQCIQTLKGPHTANCPVELTYGKAAAFMISLDERQNWIKEFTEDFIVDLSKKNLNTLYAQIHTSTGHTVNVKPDNTIIQYILDYKQ